MPYFLLALLALALPMAAAAQSVACHYSYGGETKVRIAQPAKSPYGVASIPVGTYFHFRVVFEAEPAAAGWVKVYTYSARGGSPTLIHQGTYPYPPADSARKPYGFTGLHSVYEPYGGSELQYWCELRPEGEGS